MTGAGRGEALVGEAAESGRAGQRQMVKMGEMGDDAEGPEQLLVEVSRADDGQWVLSVGDRKLRGPSLVDLAREALPDAPPDLLEHLASRDDGTWACPLPDQEQSES